MSTRSGRPDRDLGADVDELRRDMGVLRDAIKAGVRPGGHQLAEHLGAAELAMTDGRKCFPIYEPATGQWRAAGTVGTTADTDPRVGDVWIDTA